MKKIMCMVILLLLSFSLIQCSFTTRIVRQTDTTAIIQGFAVSKIEAKLNAEDRAKELFGNFKETKEADCSTGITGSASTTTANVNSYWTCVIEVKKQ